MEISEFWTWVGIGDPDECWEWTRMRRQGTHPYGLLYVNNRQRRAHRIAWELANGPIPDGIEVCHRCDNPPCCNPAHLFLGTQRDNMDDCVAKGRHISQNPEPRSRGDDHWTRRGRQGLTWQERFWTYVEKGDGCWTWLGATSGGVPVFRVDEKGNQRSASRIAWEIVNGEALPALCKSHMSCGSRLCVKPQHFRLGMPPGSAWDRRGARNPSAKLTEDQVHAIRQTGADVTTAQLAREHKVSETAIARIRKGRGWTSVT